MKRMLAHTLKRTARWLIKVANRIDEPSQITIDLQRGMVYTDASKATQADVQRMAAYHQTFFGQP